jgi:homoserine O-acetyltransferase
MNLRILITLPALVTLTATAANYPAPVEGNYTISDFHFRSGESLPQLHLHYMTLGRPERDARGVVRNAVLILHGTTGSCHQFLRTEFADTLYGPDQPLDVTRYYLIIPDNIGHGQSSKPSDGLRARFPAYGYLDMVEAQYRLLTEGLHVNHLRLVMGTSMGGMHTWLWGELHPDFMDALMPLASLPTQVSGRNRVWRRAIIDAIRDDPAWQNGNYTSPPPSMRVVADIFYFMGENPVMRWREAPTLKQVDLALAAYATNILTHDDANDVLYAVAASRDYDPGPLLEKITAPLLAINSADDLINPPELGILEREIKRVPRGSAVIIPYSGQTVGHGSHTKAVLWTNDLVRLLRQTRPESASRLKDPAAPELNEAAPAVFRARFETSKGLIVIEVHRDWAPHGADRFYNLVRSGYYDGNRFFRVIAGRWAQFGINGDPAIARRWRDSTLPDDPRRESNSRGTVAFAFAVPNGRTTQVFINLRDNSATHDAASFVPFGKVVEGMAVADALDAEYGEAAGGGIRGGKQAPLFDLGNPYLASHFPRLDYIRHAKVEGERTLVSAETEQHQPKDSR